MQILLQVNLTMTSTLYALYTKINSDLILHVISQIYRFNLQPVVSIVLHKCYFKELILNTCTTIGLVKTESGFIVRSVETN